MVFPEVALLSFLPDFDLLPSPFPSPLAAIRSPPSLRRESQFNTISFFRAIRNGELPAAFIFLITFLSPFSESLSFPFAFFRRVPLLSFLFFLSAGAVLDDAKNGEDLPYVENPELNA